MLTNGNKRECGLADAMISYIYDESTEGERRKFEAHLSGCAVCTDDFAAISSARFSVFEWQREEFAPLSTPQIIVPASLRRETEPARSFVDRLRGLFAIPGIPVAVAAALIISVALGYAFLAGDDGETNMAKEPAQPVIAPYTEPSADKVPANDDLKGGPAPTVAIAGSPEVRVSDKKQSSGSQTVPRRAVARLPQLANAKRQRVQDAPLRQTQQARRPPVLSDAVDTDDRSLRLSDLLDDGGEGR